MHGCSSASVLIVNAEVDSMGGVIEGGVGSDNKTSPHKAAIDRLQAELRQECVARDERRRELEFLEKGGNPLYFKLGLDASVSTQSTSITDQHPDRFVTSEPKGSFASTASPHGDSVESSGRPGLTPWEPNSSNNLMLFDAEHEFSEGGRSLLGRRNVGPSDQSIQMDGNLKTLEHVDSAAFGIPRKAYKRRYGSRPNRDGAWSSSTDVNPAHGCRGSSLPSRHGTRDVKGTPDAETQNISLNWNSKPASPTNNILPKTTVTNGQDDIELDDSKFFQSTKDKTQGITIDTASYASGSENPLVEQLNQPSVSVIADTPKQMGSSGPEAFHVEEMKFAVIECQPSVTGSKVVTEPHSYKMNGFSRRMRDDLLNDDHNSNASCGTKVLDSELPGLDVSLITDGKNDSEMYTRLRKIDFNGNLKDQSLQDETPLTESKKFAIEKKGTEGIDSSTLVGKESASAGPSQQYNDVSLQSEKELDKMESALENKVNYKIITEGTEAIGPTQLESGRKPAYPEVYNFGIQNETSSFLRHHDSVDVANSDHPEGGISTMVSTVPVEVQTSSASKPKLESKIDEISILKEALIIEAKRRRIAELSLVTSPVKICRNAHWDNVLEEMAWMANDFAQEHIWKVAAASQISYHVAVACLRRKNEKKSGIDVKRVAHTLAKDVMEFWHSMESQTSKELEQQCQKNGTLPIRAYAVRFLKCNKLNISHNQAVMPLTPDRISDSGVSNLIWEDCLAEENLFYTIPPGAMETYRTAIESHVAQFERTGSTVQEEVVASACAAAADLESQDNAYDEDDGETNTYNMPVAFEGSLSSRCGQKKQKHCGRSYDMGSYLLPMRFAENKLVTPQAALLAKRPGSNLNVSIPTKRVRTASRRVVIPFGAGASGFIHVPNKTDASSCDTSLFQDDQSTIRGGLFVPNCLEVESTGEFEKQFPFDTAEVSTRPKKKKKAKHLNATYEERWQVDSKFQIEQFQRDHLQKRTDSHQLESNGNSGLLGQPIAKKSKLMRQQDNSFDNILPSGRSVPSPVGSQISNMSNPNKFIKMLGGRDRGRKTRALQLPAGQPGSGVPWSLFEDQALVVLAHDLGPNWELVSDAFNSAMQFKCIFRNNRECKERHIFLMDRTSGDEGDSAENSGSSQPYPSTLPGIPKGSARQLFQRLQGPMEEETLKSHFEKIIMMGKKHHYRKTQDSKQFQQPHSSHTIALSQGSPNNLNGGPILTPLDLCDTSISCPDIPPSGYQGTHSSGLAIPNQGPITQMLPPPSSSSALIGPSNLIGNSFSSPPGSLSSSSRDVGYAVPRSGSLPADEHQRMHLYNKMIPGRNIPQPNISAPGALPGTDRGVRMLPSGNGIGIMPGVNRSMSMARPGFQGLPSSSMVNSGSAAPSGMSSPNAHAGVASVQGSSIARPPMMRPGSNQDPQRQTLVPNHQIPAKSQGTSHFGGLSSPFPNQTALPPVASCSPHHQPSHSMSPQQPQVLSPHHHQPHFQGQANHASNSQQKSYAMRLAKERQLHQRFLQQQQYAASNPLMPHGQSQPQLPISSPVQNSSQVQPQTSTPVSLPLLPSTSVNTLPQQQQKHQIPTQGVGQNAQTSGSGLANQTGKQRQRQHNQFSHANRQHPLQREAQQQGKVVKGVGSGKSMMLQNVPVDVSLSGGVSTNQVNQSLQKGDPPTNSVQSHGPYTGPLQNSVQPTRPFMASQSNQILPQQKIYSGQASSSSKHLQQTSESDNNSECPTHQKLVNQNRMAPQRPNQPDHLNNSGPSIKQQGRDSDTDQHPASSSAEMYATTLQQAPNNASNAVQVVSYPSVHKWHGSEPLSDTNALKSAKMLRSLVSMPSNSSESVPQTGQGLCPRPTTSLPLIQSDVSAQWQQQKQSQLPQTQQPLPPLHSQQQGQLLQAGSGNSNGRSSDTRLE